MPSWSDAIIADMRAHGGKVTQGQLAGFPHLIITTTGVILPYVADYPRKISRVIPVIALEPAA